MVKKRKSVGAKGAAVRRTSRRGKGQVNENASTAEDSSIIEETTSTDITTNKPPITVLLNSEPTNSSVSNTQTSSSLIKSCSVPIVVLHKKFGKYCLLNNDEGYSKKYGSDSETNSSVEIRVVDPCASSESDSNMAVDTHTDSTSDIGNFNSMNSTNNILQVHSENPSPVPICNENTDFREKDSEASNTDSIEKVLEQMEDSQTGFIENIQKVVEPKAVEETHENSTNIPQSFPDEQNNDDDDEVITIVQIIEDENPELYYNINIGSPEKSLKSNENVAKNDKPCQDESIGDFQEHFGQLNISTGTESSMNSSMECSTRHEVSMHDICNNSDLTYCKDSSVEALVRPDPSLTPSSTLSDDSNSSRVPSEHNQGNSNDSAESSPTGVRRSNRIKTISTLKQKTKGYGLVKTPLKKVLMSQTKIKLEEMSSDSSDKGIFDSQLPSSISNSPSFPIPSEMPVKVKSRWRRSSELEMGCNSPTVSPLASPNLSQRLPVVNESPIPEDELKQECTSKEDCERIIEERMQQYQHLDENEYLCDRMISKDAKKMICDCFMTKEEIERGEHGCGEDCLNRLLMIEWLVILFQLFHSGLL